MYVSSTAVCELSYLSRLVGVLIMLSIFLKMNILIRNVLIKTEEFTTSVFYDTRDLASLYNCFT